MRLLFDTGCCVAAHCGGMLAVAPVHSLSAHLIPAPLAALALPSLQILPYLLLFVYFGSLARNLADIFTGKAGLGTNGTIVFAVIRCGAWEMALKDGWIDAKPRGAEGGDRMACMPAGFWQPTNEPGFIPDPTLKRASKCTSA